MMRNVLFKACNVKYVGSYDNLSKFLICSSYQNI